MCEKGNGEWVSLVILWDIYSVRKNFRILKVKFSFITGILEEVYMKQFGEVFGKLATDKNAKSVVRDDFALEIADMDE